MKYLIFLIAILVCGTAGEAACEQAACVQAAALPVKWGLLWSGSWEEDTSTTEDFQALSGTLHNRGEIKLRFFPNEKKHGLLSPEFMLRGQVIDRHALDFSLDPPWGNPDKDITDFNGGLYHKQTGSRLLYGVLDEWGLSARIRNPWIRSPPYAENHKPLMADLKTAVSSTKEEEAYLYLSSPYFELFPNTKLRGFISGQTETEQVTPAFSGGVDLTFPKNMGLLLETFYTGKILPQTKPKTWFSDPPPLPEREFNLYSAGVLFTSPLFSASSDYALSDTWVWGKDNYCNFGVTLTPLLPFEDITGKARPLAISLAADGAGERFIGRDGTNIKPGYRGAAKIEWKSRNNSLFKLSTVLRSAGSDEEINRSSADIYYRFPNSAANRKLPVRLTRISLSADRNSENSEKVMDSFSGTIGLGINLNQRNKKNKLVNSPLGITFTGTLKGITTSEDSPFIYPVSSHDAWDWDSASVNCEFYWSPFNLQLRSRVGVSIYPEKDEKWDFSISTTIKFKQFKLSLKAASPDLPEKWNWTVSWLLQLP